MAHPGYRIGDLYAFRTGADGPWHLGLVCGVGSTVPVTIRELGRRWEFSPPRQDRRLICRTITDLAELKRRYRLKSRPALHTEDDVRAFVLPHTPYADQPPEARET